MYAPTSERVNTDITELNELYTELRNLVVDYKKHRSLVLAAGDFNAKIGKSSTRIENCIGDRNINGQMLVDFCEIHQLFVGNSSFQHRPCHKTTWQNIRNVNNKIVSISTQIDYILCPRQQKHTLVDARSYAGKHVNSDHRLLVCRM